MHAIFSKRRRLNVFKYDTLMMLSFDDHHINTLSYDDHHIIFLQGPLISNMMFLSYNDHPTGQFSQSSSYSQTFNSEFCSVEHCIVLGILSFCFVIIFCALLTQRQDSWTSPHKKINDIFQDRERQSHMISLRKKAEMPPVWEMRLKKSKRKVDFTGFTTLINLGVSNPSIQPSKKAEILQRLCSSVYSEH